MFRDNGGIFALFTMEITYLVIMTVITLILYILVSIGLYNLARERGIENPWLAWIPFTNLYILGRIIKRLIIGDFRIPYIEIILPIISLLLILFEGVLIVEIIVAIIYVLILFFAIYRLYTIYRPDCSVRWLILSIIFPFMVSIFIFVMRKDICAADLDDCLYQE